MVLINEALTNLVWREDTGRDAAETLTNMVWREEDAADTN